MTDWEEAINLNVVDIEERVVKLEQAIPADGDDYTYHYDVRVPHERDRMQLQNHGMRLRALESRLTRLELRIDELTHAVEAAVSV